MNPVEDRVIQALRARAEEADMSRATLDRNYVELQNRLGKPGQSRRLVYAAAAAAVLVIVVAVGLVTSLRGGPDQTLPAGPDRTEQAAAALVEGGFTELRRTVTEADSRAAGVSAADGHFATGDARLNLSDGRLSIFFASGEKAYQAVEVQADGRWRIAPPEGRVNGIICPESSTYQPRLTNGNLVLEPVADPCPARVAVLKGTWTR